jgi:hypothetical protein
VLKELRSEDPETGLRDRRRLQKFYNSIDEDQRNTTDPRDSRARVQEVRWEVDRQNRGQKRAHSRRMEAERRAPDTSVPERNSQAGEGAASVTEAAGSNPRSNPTSEAGETGFRGERAGEARQPIPAAYTPPVEYAVGTVIIHTHLPTLFDLVAFKIATQDQFNAFMRILLEENREQAVVERIRSLFHQSERDAALRLYAVLMQGNILVLTQLSSRYAIQNSGVQNSTQKRDLYQLIIKVRDGSASRHQKDLFQQLLNHEDFRTIIIELQIFCDLTATEEGPKMAKALKDELMRHGAGSALQTRYAYKYPSLKLSSIVGERAANAPPEMTVPSNARIFDSLIDRIESVRSSTAETEKESFSQSMRNERFRLRVLHRVRRYKRESTPSTLWRLNALLDAIDWDMTTLVGRELALKKLADKGVSEMVLINRVANNTATEDQKRRFRDRLFSNIIFRMLVSDQIRIYGQAGAQDKVGRLLVLKGTEMGLPTPSEQEKLSVAGQAAAAAAVIAPPSAAEGAPPAAPAPAPGPDTEVVTWIFPSEVRP